MGGIEDLARVSFDLKVPELRARTGKVFRVGEEVERHLGGTWLKGKITGFSRRWGSDFARVRTEDGMCDVEWSLPVLRHVDAVSRLGDLLKDEA